MSIALMSAAFKAPLPTTQKFVLVALCDSANDQGECYPSVPTLAGKCSLSERAVQIAIASIEAAGGLRREFRTGRSTIYWMTPASVANLVIGESHYVYRIDLEGGDFYIGVRTCPGDPLRDKYMGSGESLKGRAVVSKSIITKFETRQDAEEGEFRLVSQHKQDPRCVNRKLPQTPAAGAPRTSCTPQHVHPTPEPAAPPPPQHVHPTPAARAPITINEPSIEPKTKTKSAVALVPSSVAVADLVGAGFCASVAAEFIAHKSRIKAPLTGRAWADHLSESRKAGWSPVDAAEKVMARNWKGFDAKYVASEARPGFDRPAETPYQRSMREKYEKVAPQVAAKSPNHRAKPVIFDFEVEDVTPRRLG